LTALTISQNEWEFLIITVSDYNTSYAGNYINPTSGNNEIPTKNRYNKQDDVSNTIPTQTSRL